MKIVSNKRLTNINIYWLMLTACTLLYFRWIIWTLCHHIQLFLSYIYYYLHRFGSFDIGQFYFFLAMSQFNA